MRHGKKFNHLGRTAPHRKAMLANMACSLIEHKKITTTVAKAKALRKYVEPLITKSKTDSTHSRRVVFSYLKNKEAIKELFGEISNRVADRPGGYTRILKIGNRLGDNAEMAIIELVDFSEYASDKAGGSRRKRRRKKSKKAEAVAAAETAPEVVEQVEEAVEEVQDTEAGDLIEDAEVIEEPVEEAATEEEETPEETPEEEDGETSEEEKDENKEE